VVSTDTSETGLSLTSSKHHIAHRASWADAIPISVLQQQSLDSIDN